MKDNKKEGDPKHKMKVVLLGDRGVGKSSIIRRFINNNFEQMSQPTVGVDFMAKCVKYQNCIYKIELWDTAGQEKYRSLVKGYLKGADACILVYECTSKDTIKKDIQSYINIAEWITMFDSVAKTNASTIIVGNKCDASFDLQDLQTKKEQFRKNNKSLDNIYEIMSSAKLGVNIWEIFQYILQNHQKNNLKPDSQKQIQSLVNTLNKIPCCHI